MTTSLVFLDFFQSLTKADLHAVLPNPKLISRVRVLKETTPNSTVKPNVIDVRVMDT